MFQEAENLHLNRARQTQRLLGTRLFSGMVPLGVAWSRVGEPGAFATHPEARALAPIVEGEHWGGGWDHAWFRFTGVLPEAWSGRHVVAWIDLGTEGLVFDKDGRVTQGISPGNLFNNIPWKGTRPLVEIAPLAKDEQICFWVQASAISHPDPELNEEPVRKPLPKAGHWNGVLNHAKLVLFDDEIWALYMDFEVLIDLLESLPAKAVRRAKLLRLLTLSSEAIARNPADFAGVRAALRPAFDKPANASDLRVCAVGHGHLDTAWLWPVSTGRQKCARTVANQLLLMDQYPAHVFGFSAALHYQWLKEDHPDLFERVRARIREGRWEVQGMVWVEADGNMPSGESLIRQFLHGAHWFRENLGVASNFLWLPDVFGYPASLPQIMKHCGAESLVTQKVSWSLFNKFPHHAFRWRGIDGTEVISYFPPENNYCSNHLPSGLIEGQERCAERDRLDSMLSLFGYGDGGGGPHAKHLERTLRCSNLEGCPPVKVSTAGSFLDDLCARRELLDIWEGPFYVEGHHGTLTTHAFVKWANRRLEEQLQSLEILWSSAGRAAWPAAEFDALWKTVLRNQFHDIIPGSSIREVYETVYPEYRDALASADALAERFARQVLSQAPGSLTLFNSLPGAWRDAIRLPALPAGAGLRDSFGQTVPVQSGPDGALACVDVPALGFATFTLVEGAASTPSRMTLADGPFVLENHLVRYEFDANARLVRAFDKERGRELIPTGETGNLFSLYNDMPCQWEAWDIDIFYEQELIATAETVEPITAETGPVRNSLRARLRVGDSEIRQAIALQPGSRRLDFETEIAWREERRLLRVSFPVAIRAATAAYEIPFGHVMQPTHRNTSRDMAMFEHSAHRFADLSDPDYGVALLNDGKYGHKIHGHVIDLALLRAPLFPDPQADRGSHSFRYALLPHPGPLSDGVVLAEAARFNRPPTILAGTTLPANAPVFPVRLLDGEVSLEALKRAEDGKTWILRLVERRGRHAVERLHFTSPATLVETDGLEFLEGKRTQVTEGMAAAFAPFQIRTWKIVTEQASQCKI